MNGRRNLTQIPPDVELFPMEHVVNLLRVIAAERDELYMALQHEHAHSATVAAVAAATAVYPTHQHQHHLPTEAFGFSFTDTIDDTPPLIAAVTPPTALNDIFKVDAVKKRIAKKSYMLVKKTPHNITKKPYTELNEAVPNRAAALALFEGFQPKSDTNRLITWNLTGEEVVGWLHSDQSSPKHKYIHPVKFDGKVITFGGAKPFVYAWACYESLQAKFDKKSNSLALKFRTKMVGSGRPDEGAADSPPRLS